MGNFLNKIGCALVMIAALLGAFARPAAAGVTITFYSHNFHAFHGIETEFPHGFVILSGTDESGAPVHANLGFSAISFYGLALFTPVDGALDDEPLPGDYVAEANFHFAFVLSDEQYRAVMAVADKWRNARQPSYDFYNHNCVTFVQEIAVAAGLSVSYDRKFIHAPREFLDDVGVRNRAFLAQYSVPQTAPDGGAASPNTSLPSPPPPGTSPPDTGPALPPQSPELLPSR